MVTGMDGVAGTDGVARRGSGAGGDDQAAWREQRRQAGFVRRAAERGLEAHPLTARTFDGRATYRTKVRGWYLKSNRSVAVGADGGYYLLTVPASLRARFTGAELAPSTPRLIVGAGGGDGETVPLAQLLDRRLEAGTRWP